jgi:hypothetical protein
MVCAHHTVYIWIENRSDIYFFVLGSERIITHNSSELIALVDSILFVQHTGQLVLIRILHISAI